MIEEKLEAFVEKEGMSTDDLMNECRRVKEIGDAASVRYIHIYPAHSPRDATYRPASPAPWYFCHSAAGRRAGLHPLSSTRHHH